MARRRPPAEPEVLRNELLGVRFCGEGQQLALVLNLQDDAAEVELPLPGARVLAGACGVRSSGHPVVVTAAPHGFLVVGS